MRRFLIAVCWCIAVGVASARPEERNRRVHVVTMPHLSAEVAKPLPPTSTPPSCDSRIFCQGPLLHVVQMAQIFNDSKHFVDMMMLDDEATILRNFDAFMADNQQKPSRNKIRQFVFANFAETHELDKWTPDDYEAEPPLLAHIESEDVRNFTAKIIAIWPLLGRKMSDETLANIERHSLLPLREGFIIPGGRFKETYYWDSYWIIKGLLISNMRRTARGMLSNFVALIERHGFIPNGARVYYAQRSQPPLFAAMVYEYYKATGDTAWVRANLRHVDTEVMYWLEKRRVPVVIDGVTHRLARYYPASLGPRPESYKEDFKTASALPTDAAKQRLYANLKGGAESGWDFSSRWFYDADGNSGGNLSQIDTERTIPVDLNAFLYKACASLSALHLAVNQLEDAGAWLARAVELRDAIHAVHYAAADGTWYDYDLVLKRHRHDFYVSNLAPLWANAQHAGFEAERLIETLHRDAVFEYEGGTPTSLRRTGEQWDLPNAWPPLQAIFVQALANTRTREGEMIAERLAQRWIVANMIGMEATGAMFEKYDAIEAGEYGGGGEYEVQTGFGWTNGVALEFIRDYYTDLNNI